MSSSTPLPAATKKPMTAHFQLLKLSTQIKLGELTKHERKLETHYTDLLAKTELDGDDAGALSGSKRSRQQLEGLYEGVKDLQVVQSNVHAGLEDVGGLVEFAACDPWSTEAVVAQRKQQILREVRQRRSLWQHNKLLGELLMASLEETEHDQDDGELVQAQEGDPDSPTASSSMALGDDGGAGPLLGLTKEETQKRLETYFFESSGVREDDVFEFLETQVFQERHDFSRAKTLGQQKALHQARSTLGNFGDRMLRGDNPVTEEDVTCCIAAVLRDKAFLSADVVALFTDAQRNKQIMKELAHVLTIELSNVREWHWPETGVHVDIQRGMNGRFRCLLQEDAVTLLLFQYIGLKWSIQIKAVLRNLLNSVSDLPSNDSFVSSVESSRVAMMQQFQMFALADSMESAGTGPYDDSDDDNEAAAAEETKTDKQNIIRRVCVEAHLQRMLTGEGKTPSSLVAVMTDLEFFGPSISREAVFAILRFLGVREDMLNVFRRYTEIPLLFSDFATPKIMQRGLPVSRMMTMLLSEVELFVMDYLVLVSADIFLFRSHDDICFFDTDEKKVLRAWDEMQRYAQCVGLKFNAEKSGSIRMSAAPDAAGAQPGPAPLPETSIRWGLVELQSNGTVSIRQDEVTAFATEMADRLAAATSPFSWINVYNKYMLFFLRNFGKPSPLFGLAHLEEAMATLSRIHRLVFPKTDGDALGYLREQITRGRHGPAPLMPAAWLYWPLNLGGLGLCNPFLVIWGVKESMYSYLSRYHRREDREWPKLKKDWEWQAPFTTLIEKLKCKYEVFAERFQTEGRKALKEYNTYDRFAYLKSSKYTDKERNSGQREPKFDDTFTLRTFDEYMELLPSVQEQRLVEEFQALLVAAAECAPPLPKSALQNEAEQMFTKGHVSGSYSEWVAYIYSAQVMEEFGTLSFFSHELLPAQLIESIKKKTVTW